MRELVKLYKAVKDQDSEKMLSYLKSGSLYFSPDYPLQYITANCKFRLASEVSAKLQDVSPILSDQCDGTNFSTEWVARSILSAMYAMFYMDMLKGVAVRECRNPTCRECFTVNLNDKREARKIYCSHSCVAAVTQREYRKKKRAEKEVQP
jgi:ribosomal protein L37AE/L43A